MRRICILIIVLFFIATCGCAGVSTCIPVKVTEKYKIDGDSFNAVGGVVIIEKTPIRTYESAFKKIRVNETNNVKFESNLVVGTVINSVCDIDDR